MKVERYHTSDRMSRVVRCNGFLYLSGLVSSPECQKIEEQTRDILAKIEELLNMYGSDKNHVLSALIHLRDMNLFSGMNSVWDSWVDKNNKPARTCVEANMASEKALVEITVIAALVD